MVIEMQVLSKLVETYGYNEPILLKEVKILGLTKENTRQIFHRLQKKGLLNCFSQGVYYLPTETHFGKSLLSSKKVYEKKYICDGENIYGYYAGLVFMNAIGLTSQMPNIVEIVTNNESSRGREVKVGYQKVRVRKSVVTVTNHNVKVLQFLDLMNQVNVQDMSEGTQKELRNYVQQQCFKKEEVFAFIDKFGSRVAKELVESGLIHELT